MHIQSFCMKIKKIFKDISNISKYFSIACNIKYLNKTQG